MYLCSFFVVFCSALSALRRSKKKVRAVITTELPFLISKEFSSNQESEPNLITTSADGFSTDATAEMHRARWSALFDQMDKALSEEEKQLVSYRKATMFIVILRNGTRGFFFW